MVNVGVIGCGQIGRDHISRLSSVISGVRVAGVYDIIRTAAEKSVQDFNLDAKVYPGEDELINAPDIDAVIVCSSNDTHLSPVLKSIAAGKPVFVEKPMTISAKDSFSVVSAEVAKQKRYVQVGFNRRYDTGYWQLKNMIDAGTVGALLLANCRHYNTRPSTNYYKTDNVINDTLIHDIDILRYLFAEEFHSIEMRFARPNSLNQARELREPQLALIEMKSGALVVVELNVNCQYGYDIQCRLVGETGIISLPDVATPELRKAGQISHAISDNWTERFIDAYNREFQAFIDNVSASGSPAATATAWDGYAASVIADAAIQSLHQGGGVDILLPEKPALYDK
ncbi:Gfo/Idh/MocA family oxidoreductase [Brenneria izadpanahii]|uniref:Gfo/Idh/MocA family oxidoreductase n=1 Tax=Brenneria izadpanahii TaxID=2722756 RepID=A0ABX7UTE3_9GAMM|nr:Gfo/Idh/MocA family oxidoreductase [Brenneria izadpanahii]QTF09008.1 Gfo/Idh/MocA family oxidoreductase [Brenneria izadpanahii]